MDGFNNWPHDFVLVQGKHQQRCSSCALLSCDAAQDFMPQRSFDVSGQVDGFVTWPMLSLIELLIVLVSIAAPADPQKNPHCSHHRCNNSFAVKDG